MLTFQEVNELCQRNRIEFTVVSVRNYSGDTPWTFNANVEFNDNGTRIEHRASSPDLAEADNSAFAKIHQISREGFKFPIMLEAPADVA